MNAVVAKLADPFFAAAVRVLTAELGSEVEQHDQVVETSPLTGGEVTIMVGVTGEVKGLMAIAMPLATASAIAGVMMGEPVAELDEMAKSAVAELGNMVAGLATVQLEGCGYASNITPPSVITGTSTVISTNVGADRLVVPLSTTFGRITVHVALKTTAA